MYFPAFLRMAGFTIEEAYKCYMGGVVYIGSIERVYAQYHEWVGNYSAMMFYPLILAGFYLIFTEDEESAEYKRLWILLTVGFTGLLMTHMLSCLLVGSYALLCCLVMIKKVFRKKVLRELLKAVGAAVLLNLWYLVPFMQYMMCETLCINSELTWEEEVIDYYAHLADFTQEGRSLFNLFIRPGSTDYMIAAVLLLYIVTIPIQKKNTETKRSRGIFIATALAF